MTEGSKRVGRKDLGAFGLDFLLELTDGGEGERLEVVMMLRMGQEG